MKSGHSVEFPSYSSERLQNGVLSLLTEQLFFSSNLLLLPTGLRALYGVVQVLLLQGVIVPVSELE